MHQSSTSAISHVLQQSVLYLLQRRAAGSPGLQSRLPGAAHSCRAVVRPHLLSLLKENAQISLSRVAEDSKAFPSLHGSLAKHAQVSRSYNLFIRMASGVTSL